MKEREPCFVSLYFTILFFFFLSFFFFLLYVIKIKLNIYFFVSIVVPIPIPKMEELSVFQQQQQPLDFRTNNSAAAAYEMSARLNNPLLAAVKSNPVNPSISLLQALQTNPALLNEYIRVNGINSAASSVVGSTSTTTIPNGNKQKRRTKIYKKYIYIRYFSYFIYLLVNEA